MPAFSPSHLPHLLRTGLVALLIVIGAEITARIVLGPDDDWKFWRIAVGERIDILEALAEPPDVLFVGDSTAASNLVPATWTRTSGYTSYNLGTRGNLLGSFGLTMIDTILPALKNQPRAFVVSFSPNTYGNNPFFERVSDQLNQSLFARSARGELIWGDWFYLARIKHQIRALQPHQSNDPGFAANHGWQPFEITEAQKRPNARTRVPRAPWARPKPKTGQRIVKVLPEKLEVLERFGKLAGDRPVIWIVPPADHRDEALRQALLEHAPDNVTIWDYSHTKYKRAEGSHLGEQAAREFTQAVARRFRQDGVLEP